MTYNLISINKKRKISRKIYIYNLLTNYINCCQSNYGCIKYLLFLIVLKTNKINFSHQISSSWNFKIDELIKYTPPCSLYIFQILVAKLVYKNIYIF